jgi:hypothetical protein
MRRTGGFDDAFGHLAGVVIVALQQMNCGFAP